MATPSTSAYCKKPKLETISAEQTATQDHYFNMYAQFGVHEEMLKDEVRTLSYRDAIYCNQDLFVGKTVIDVGCGTGILSMFAARAGAKRVFAIEASSIVDYASKIIKANKLDHIVTVIRGKVEAVELPHGEHQVDIIISEWMGHCLFYENMLPTVLFARDKWLKPGGLLLPDRCSMFITAIEDKHYKEYNIDWWKNVYGFDMGSIQKEVIAEALLDYVDPQQIVTSACLVKELDLYTITKEDLKFSTPFSLEVKRTDYIHAFVTFFDVAFTKGDKKIAFSTGPNALRTHWKQTLFYFDNFLTVLPREKIDGIFSLKSSPKSDRVLDFVIEVNFKGKLCTVHEKYNYHLY